MTLETDNVYDAIVIGSGIGGLATASLLAQIGNQRVLVLESHFKLGGFTHSFRRQDYEWDVGVHYIGQMNDGSMTRRLMDLVTGGAVQWHRMGSPFERFMFPQGNFDVPPDPDEFQQRLIERFPAEHQAIEQYFRDLQRAQGWIARWFASKQYSRAFASLLTFWGRSLVRQTTEQYLHRFEDPLLRAILAAQWPDFGSPPRESAFGFHATVAADFLQGGFYPIGGSKRLASSMVGMITAHGGRCLASHPVAEILVEKGRARGVIAERQGEKKTFRAPVIISNAGVGTTFEKLVPHDFCIAEREQSRRLRVGTSALILFLGLKADPRTAGFLETNYWLYNQLDHNVHMIKPEDLNGAFVSFGSLRNPGQFPHVAQVITFSSSDAWQEFAGSRWRRRGSEYEQQKRETSEAMLAFAERFLPGLRDLVVYQELSTPLTIESFTGHRAGMTYGQACDPNRLFRDSWSVGTSLPGLYLTGSDVGTPGVNGALMAGVMTAGKLLGVFGIPRIMTRAYMAKRR